MLVLFFEKIVIFCLHFLLFLPSRSQLLLATKNRRAKKNFHNARSLQENVARSAANQCARTIVAI